MIIMEKPLSEISKPANKEEPTFSKLSFCGIMKENTSELIHKLESEMPSLFQESSDLYARYLHSIQDVYGVCSLAEKEYCDELMIDKNMLKTFDEYSKFVSKIFESNFDLSASFLRSYVQFRLSFMDSWDALIHSWVNMHAKSFSQYLSTLSSKK